MSASVLPSLALFAVSLALSVGASFVLSRELDRIGVRLGITEGLLGILTALGADAPEISTAAVAVLSHNTSIGVGVVLGSNVFNLAALLGLGALVAGGVHVGRYAALLEGSAATAVALIAVVLALGWVNAWAAFALCVFVLTPYAVLASIRVAQLPRLPTPRLRSFMRHAVSEGHRAARLDHLPAAGGLWSVLLVPPALATVVLGSIGMVHAATRVGGHWSISAAVMGTLVLAILTSIPNAVAALRLASHHRGAAVVAEAYNSNSANILAGLCLPAAIIGLHGSHGLGVLTASWALFMTALSVVLLARAPGLTRKDGVALIAMYVLFIAVILFRY
jgi:cation:H+ antiporter